MSHGEVNSKEPIRMRKWKGRKRTTRKETDGRGKRRDDL